MNARLFKIFQDNERLTSIILGLMVCLMLVFLSISVVNLANRFYPDWNGIYLLIVTALISAEALLSYKKIKYNLEFGEKIAYHFAKWIIVAVILKAAIYLSGDPGQLWIDLQNWQKDFGQFFQGGYVFSLLFLVVVYWISSSFAEDLERLETDVTDFRWEQGKLENDRQASRKRLAQRALYIGATVVILTLLTRVDMRQIFGETPASQVSIAYVLVYFLLLLVFLSLTQFSLQKGKWFWNQAPISPQIGKNWFKYSAIFFLILVILAFLLPTRYTFGLLELLQLGLSYLSAIAMFIFSVVAFPILWLLSLFGIRRGQDAPNPPQLTMPNLPQAAGPTETVAWFELLKSILFWAIFLGVIGFAFWHYLRQNPAIFSTLLRFPFFRGLASFFRGLFNWIQGVNRQIGAVIAENMERLRRLRFSPAVRQAQRWLNFGRLSPRQQIIFYYLKVLENSAQLGWKRKPHQTPLQFEEELKQGIPEAGAEVSALTGQFVEARYSQHPIDEHQSGQVQTFWRKIMRAIKSKSHQKSSQP